MALQKLTPPPADAPGCWYRDGVRLAAHGLPGIATAAAAVVAGALMAYDLAAPLGPVGLVVVDLLFLSLVGPLFHWLGFGVVQRLDAGARGLVLPQRLAPASTLASIGLFGFAIPAAWCITAGPIAISFGIELFPDVRERIAFLFAVSVMSTGSATTAGVFRIARGQLFGADSGPDVDLDARDRLALVALMRRMLPVLSFPAAAVFLAGWLSWTPLSLAVLLPQTWAVATSYLAARDLFGGRTSQAARAVAAPQAAPDHA